MSDDDEDILSGRRRLFQRSQERAYSCLNEQQYPRAFAHFLVALTIQPDADETFLETFFFALEKVVSDLENAQNWDELLTVYQHSLEVLPHDPHILHSLASVLFRLGHIESATKYFQEAYKENPFFTPSLYCIDNIKNALVERWHFTMMNDRGRNSAYEKAIQQAIKDGNCKSVLDIGAGTGILSMIATDAGAEQVFACEGNQVMFGVLQKVIGANKKSVKLLPKFSYDIKIPTDLPEKVSLVVTEIFDAGLLGENVLSTLKHAWEHLILSNKNTEKKSLEDLSLNERSSTAICGKVIPHSATVFAAPLECDKIRSYYWASPQVVKIFEISDSSVTAGINYEEPYTTEKLAMFPGGYQFLSSPKSFLTINFNDIEDITSLLNGKSLSLSFEVLTAGRLDAVAVWFELNLDKSTKICTGPENDSNCWCWEQSVFCVLPKHLHGSSSCVQTNDVVEVTFLCKNHLTLEQVRTTSILNSTDKFLSVDSYAIQSLNSYSVNNILSLNLNFKVQKPDAPVIDISYSVIDVSSFPTLGLKALKDGAHKLIVLPSQYLRSIYELQTFCGFSTKQIRSMSYEDLCLQPVKCSMIICEPVEMSGLLKKNIFEDIALLRTLNQKESPPVFPKKITIFTKLIDSPELFQQAKVTSDENCLGYKISEFLNNYQSVIQQDLQLSAVPYTQLSDVLELCDINLNQLFLEKSKLQSFVEFQGTIPVKITKSGNITALPFWFSLCYDDDCSFDTSCAKIAWKQAAIIPETPISVCENEDVILEWNCRNSCLNIIVKKEQ